MTTTDLDTPAATGRRITPTATRLLPADAPRDQWLARRRQGIGSSDVAAILGVSDYATPLHVWHDKRGDLTTDDAGEAALWGTLLEDTVAREWCRRNRSVIQRVGLVANIDRPWMMATLDRRVAECPLNRAVRTACGLEVKTRSAFKANRWRADVPDDVLAQCAWQMAVTGYDHIHVACLIGGNDYQQRVVRHDPALEGFLLGEVTRFREQHLIAGARPDWDPDKAQSVIDLDAALHPDKAGSLEVDLDVVGEVMEYATASAAKGAADRRLKEAKAKLAVAANGHKVMTFADELAYSYEPRVRRNVDLERLAAEHPAAYDACVTDNPHYAIKIAPAYRNGATSNDQ